MGEHVVKTYCKQQKVIALSTGEAELYAMVAASAETLALLLENEQMKNARLQQQLRHAARTESVPAVVKYRKFWLGSITLLIIDLWFIVGLSAVVAFPSL